MVLPHCYFSHLESYVKIKYEIISKLLCMILHGSLYQRRNAQHVFMFVSFGYDLLWWVSVLSWDCETITLCNLSVLELLVIYNCLFCGLLFTCSCSGWSF